jgi:hypothetical protein
MARQDAGAAANSDAPKGQNWATFPQRACRVPNIGENRPLTRLSTCNPPVVRGLRAASMHHRKYLSQKEIGSSGWIRTSNPSMWPPIVNPLTSDSLRPECRKAPSSVMHQDGCAGASDERFRHVRSPHRASWRLHVGGEDHRPRTTFYPWGAAAPTPDALRPKAVRQPGGERPHLWYGVCPHPVAGPAARTSSRRSDPTDRDPPSLLSHASVSGSPLRESLRHRDIARVRSVISGPLRQSRCDGVAARR